MNAPMGSSRSLFPPDAQGNGARSAEGRRAAIDPERLLRRHIGLILTCFVVVTALSVLAIAWLPPAYVVTAKVLIQPDDATISTFFSGLTPSHGPTSEEPAARRMEDEMEMADLWPVAAAAVQKLHLSADDVYRAPLASLLKQAQSLWDRLAAVFGVRPSETARADDLTVGLFRKSYSVGLVTSKSADTNSNIILFTLYGADPDRAQTSLQAVLDAYIEHANKLKRAAAEKANAVVTEIAATARRRALEAQAQLDDFLASNSGSADGRLAQNRAEATDLDRMVRLRQQEVVDVEHRLAQIRTSLDIAAREVNSRIVVEPPIRPTGSEAGKRLVVAAAASVAGLLLGVFLAGLRELSNRRLRDAADVGAKLGLPVLASLPELAAEEQAAVLSALGPTDEARAGRTGQEPARRAGASAAGETPRAA